MARVSHRLDTARRALATLDELADEPTTKIVRDASIQRFEYSFEATWKAAQAVLLDRFGLELASPKSVVRASFENAVLTEEEARSALAMVDHRNLTSHTYDETLADQIFAALPGYRHLLRIWIERLSAA